MRAGRIRFGVVMLGCAVAAAALDRPERWHVKATGTTTGTTSDAAPSYVLPAVLPEGFDLVAVDDSERGSAWYRRLNLDHETDDSIGITVATKPARWEPAVSGGFGDPPAESAEAGAHGARRVVPALVDFGPGEPVCFDLREVVSCREEVNVDDVSVMVESEGLSAMEWETLRASLRKVTAGEWSARTAAVPRLAWNSVSITHGPTVSVRVDVSLPEFSVRGRSDGCIEISHVDAAANDTVFSGDDRLDADQRRAIAEALELDTRESSDFDDGWFGLACAVDRLSAPFKSLGQSWPVESPRAEGTIPPMVFGSVAASVDAVVLESVVGDDVRTEVATGPLPEFPSRRVFAARTPEKSQLLRLRAGTNSVQFWSRGKGTDAVSPAATVYDGRRVAEGTLDGRAWRLTVDSAGQQKCFGVTIAARRDATCVDVTALDRRADVLVAGLVAGRSFTVIVGRADLTRAHTVTDKGRGDVAVSTVGDLRVAVFGVPHGGAVRSVEATVRGERYEIDVSSMPCGGWFGYSPGGAPEVAFSVGSCVRPWSSGVFVDF